MGFFSGSLILTGILWFAVGWAMGFAPDLDPGHYFFCMPGGLSEWFGGSYSLWLCQNLFLYNTIPALFLIIGVILLFVGL